MEAREAYVALNLIENVGPARLRQLEEFFGDPVAILRASRDRLMQVPQIGPETAESIARWESTIDLSGEFRNVEACGARVITRLDMEYPTSLKEIYDPPIVLYIKGSLLSQDNRGIAIVGSRQTTSYGMEVARKLGYQLAYAGVTVVSGGARGIDTGAHLGAIAAKGRSIAVLGTGINLVFPPENRELFERLAESGAVLTQFPFNRPADKQSFPIRNRIVAGMTLGTVVVEANLTSGALITANFAIDYGRQVFAVPGRIDNPRSRGCHDLLKKGAKLCEGVDDILSEFEYLFPPQPSLPTTAQGLSSAPLSDNERVVLEALTDGEEQSTDQVIHATKLSPSAVSVALLSLELKRRVQQLPGKLFIRRTNS